MSDFMRALEKRLFFMCAHLSKMRQGMIVLCVGIALFGVALNVAPNAYALGIGKISQGSSIGDVLSLQIPLFNVRDPESLQIELNTQGSEQSNSQQFFADLEQTGSGFVVSVRSTQAVNAPYIKLSLLLRENDHVFLRDFDVLLSVPAYDHSSEQAIAYGASELADTADVLNRAVQTKGLMGPYDWAEKGRVANKFGPVLDGQSLWRVARRINKALGVSINQMMLSLYQANRNAFSSNSVDSLQAGSLLAIPSVGVVTQYNDAQANLQLSELGSSLAEPTVGKTQATIVQDLDLETEKVALNDQVKVDRVKVDQGEVSAIESQDQAATLTIKKAVSLGGNSPELVNSPEPKNSPELVNNPEQENNTTQTAVAPIPERQSKDTASQAVVSDEPQFSKVNNSPRWWFVLLILFVVFTLIYFLRNRFVLLFTMGSKNKQLDQVLNGTNAVVAEAKPDAPKDFSTMTAVTRMIVDASINADTQYDNVAALVPSYSVSNSATDSVLEFENNESHLNFSENFQALLDKQDYSFARQLLDFTHENGEIDTPRYHCERLQVLQSTNDRDGFYHYYSEIENEVPSYNLAIRTRISQMLVSL